MKEKLNKASVAPRINTHHKYSAMPSVYIYSRVETSVELELPFPLANRGRTRMGEEDNDHESDEDIVFLRAGIGRHWATTKEN